MKKLLALLLLLTIYYLLFTIPSPAHAVGICPGLIEEDHSGGCCDWGNKSTNAAHIDRGDPGCDACYMGNFDNPQHTKPFGPCKYCHADVCVYGSGCEQTCNWACCAGADSFCTEDLPRDDVDQGPTRPYPCNICLEAMPEPISLFCADQFQPQDVITYLENEGDPDPPHTVIKTWGGPIEVDLTDTEMPLVGKAQLNIADKELEDQTRVQEYLADYFEGTALYDQEPIDLETGDLEKLREETRRILTYGGVFRKLAPKELQDKLRENMVMRAKGEEPRWPGATDIVHNYIVVYVKEEEIVSPGEPDSEEIRLLDFLDYLRPIREDYETDEEYYKAVEDWEKEEIKGVKLPLLWAYVPMFSREDVPGRVDLELEKEHDDDSLTINSPPENQKIYLPHLARLNEVSDWVYQIFHTLGEKLTSWKGPLIAQPKNLPNTDSRVLSASNQDFGTCDHEDDALWNPGDKICGQPITAELSATEEFENTNYRQPSPPTPPPVPCGECADATECPLGYSCMNTCCVPPPQPKVYTKDVSRKIDVLVRIPFLDDLWEKIVAGKEEDDSILQSIFRIFFPHEELVFDDYDYPGMGSLTYKYKGSTEFVKAGDDKKGHEAKIYYDHLGGLRCIRDKVLERLLPAETEFVPFCAAMPIPIPSPGPIPTPGPIEGGCAVCGAPIESETLVQIFGQAGTAFKVPGSVLAGVANFEGFHPGASHLFDYPDRWVIEDSRQGARDRNCATSPAGARGPMQFMPNQWKLYKNAAIEAGARPSGYQPEICNILDAIYAAAKKLRHDVGTFNDGTNCNCGKGTLSSSECATSPAPTDCNWEKGDVYHATCHYYGNCTSNYCATCWQFYQNYSCEEEE